MSDDRLSPEERQMLLEQARDALVSGVGGAPQKSCTLEDFPQKLRQPGVVFVLTIGTGIGTALFTDGILVPNTELGHIRIKGIDAEHLASDAARKREGLSWKRWSKRFNLFLEYIDALFWPNLIILGGGAAKKHKKFIHHLHARCPIVPAQFHNNSGIVGAAMNAVNLQKGNTE